MSKRSLTLLAAAGAAFVLVLGVRPGAAQVPAELVVDDDAVECPAATHATIQAAVDAVPSGGDANITVCAGAYDELVAISGKGAVRITGVGGPVLTPPGITGDGRLIDVSASRKVVIEGMTLDGNGEFTGATSIRGIRVSDTSARILGNTVRNVHNATPDAASAIGIQLSDLDPGDGTSKWTVADNVVDGYGAVGILAQGAGGTATISRNAVTGLGTRETPFNTRFAIGIDVQLQASARIVHNTISQNWYEGPGCFVAPGVYLYEEKKVVVARNTLTGNQGGVWVDSCCDGFPSLRNRVAGNTISGALYGILVEVANVDGATLVTPVNSKNAIVNNTLTTTVPNSAGVWLAKVDFDGAGVGIDPQLDDNRIGPNAIDGFTFPCIDQGTNTSTPLTCSH